MKSLQNEETVIESIPKCVGKETRPGFFGRIREIVKRFKQDLRRPLPGTAQMGFLGRIRIRFLYLFKIYGWKLLVAIFMYYLIRDVLLYIVIPYLVAKQFF